MLIVKIISTLEEQFHQAVFSEQRQERKEQPKDSAAEGPRERYGAPCFPKIFLWLP